MKAQTCCCHICRTSLNQYKREFIPCTRCNKIVCKNCFGTKWRGESWESANQKRDHWSCPACEGRMRDLNYVIGTCTCPRCKKSPKTGLNKPHEELKSPSKSRERELHNKFQHYVADELYSGDSNDGYDIMASPESESEADNSTINQLENLKMELHKFKDEDSFLDSIRLPHTDIVAYNRYQDVLEREKRVEQTIREMEKLLYIMNKERSEIMSEKKQLEAVLNSSNHSKDMEMTSIA